LIDFVKVKQNARAVKASFTLVLTILTTKIQSLVRTICPEAETILLIIQCVIETPRVWKLNRTPKLLFGRLIESLIQNEPSQLHGTYNNDHNIYEKQQIINE
jgi:hypothetical protein